MGERPYIRTKAVYTVKAVIESYRKRKRKREKERKEKTLEYGRKRKPEKRDHWRNCAFAQNQNQTLTPNADLGFLAGGEV
jgi:hypothetical protein